MSQETSSTFLPERNRVKVLYIAGWQRSGSTVLSNILGQIEGFFVTGELYYLWDYVWFRDILCGCGDRFSDCTVWNQVLESAFSGRDGVDGTEMRELALLAGRTRHLPLLLIPGVKRLLVSRLKTYLINLERLYLGIRSTTNSRVIVDSSKWPSYGYVLGMIPTVDLYVVHLIRDPRAVAYSWLCRKVLPDRERPEYMYRSLMNSSARWAAWNVAIETFWRRKTDRYLMLRYEDFVEEPQNAVRRILELLLEQDPKLPFVSEREVELRATHTVSGNPNRFDVGRVELRADEKWRTKMRYREKVAVTALTLPMLKRYRYTLRP